MIKLTIISLSLMVCLSASAPTGSTEESTPTTTRKPFVKLSCKGHNPNGFFVDEKDPHIFHECVNGEHIADFSCGAKLVFDESKQVCVEKIDDHGHTPKCPEPNGMFPDPDDKHKFIECNAGNAFVFTCPGNLVYDPKSKNCAYEEDDSTGTPRNDVTIPPGIKCPQSEGLFPYPGDKHKFLECSAGYPYIFFCPGKLVFDVASKTCVEDGSPQTAGPVTTPPSHQTTSKPQTKAPTGAPATNRPDFKCETSEGLFPYPGDKHKFIECSAGNPFVFNCPGKLVFDMKTKNCINDDTTDSPQTDGTEAPTRAPTTSEPETRPPKTDAPTEEPVTHGNEGTTRGVDFECKTDGYFADPSDKHRYIVCSKGEKKVMSCPSGQQFNEALQMCT